MGLEIYMRKMLWHLNDMKQGKGSENDHLETE